LEENIRKQAIQRYMSGEKPKSIYTNLNRSKKWFFKWLKRFKEGDPNWYQSQSRAPKHSPLKISNQQYESIVKTRKELVETPFSQTGTSAIKWEMHKSGIDIPSDSTINRVLHREGLLKKN